MNAELTAALTDALVAAYGHLVEGQDEVSALGLITRHDGTEAVLTAQTPAGETAALIASGLEFVTDSAEVREQFRWDPRAHRLTDGEVLTGMLEGLGLLGAPDAADHLVAALHRMQQQGTPIDGLGAEVPQTILVTDDPDPDRARVRIEAINPPAMAAAFSGLDTDD